MYHTDMGDTPDHREDCQLRTLPTGKCTCDFVERVKAIVRDNSTAAPEAAQGIEQLTK